MSKVWGWLKKYWKWVVFPVGAATAVLGWFVKETQKAQDVKEASIKELEKAHAVKLSSMSEDQREEFERVRKLPVDEVAKWIDDL